MNGEPVLLLNNVRCAEKLAWGFGQKMKCRCISLSDAFDFQRGMISDRTFGPFKTGQMCNGKMQSVENEVLLEYRRTDASKTLRFMVAVKCVVAGVVLDDAVLPFAGVDVGVDLGGEYAFVA